MERDLGRFRLIVAAAGAVVLVAAVAFILSRGEKPVAAERPGATVVRWQAPSSGARAVTYLLRIQVLGGASEDTVKVAAQPGPQQSFVFTQARPGLEYRACISGIDDQGRQGPWSGWSPVYRRGAVAE